VEADKRRSWTLEQIKTSLLENNGEIKHALSVAELAMQGKRYKARVLMELGRQVGKNFQFLKEPF
jgi:hypothetical protein